MSGLAKGIEKSRGMVNKAVSGVASDLIIQPRAAVQGMQGGRDSSGDSSVGELLGGLREMLSGLQEMAGGGTICIPVYTPQLGIRAQVQHLKAYASTDTLKNACIDPRFRYVTRGCAEYAEWLGQKENPSGKGWAAGAGYGEKILSILKGILGTAGGEVKPEEAWYRVRKSWADASSQKGAFKSLENAKKCADENPGHSVFDESGKAVYPKAAAFQPYLVRVSIPIRTNFS